MLPIPLYDPVYYDDRQAERPLRRFQGGELARLLHRRPIEATSSTAASRPIGGIDRQEPARRRPARSRRRSGSWSSSTWPNSLRSSSPRTTNSADRVGRLLRSGGVPVALLEDRARSASSRRPISSSSTSAATPPSGMAADRTAAREPPDDGDLRRRADADPELILQAMRAGANEFFMWPVPEDSFHGAVRRTRHAARERAGRGQAALGDDGLLRRQGRRRHDDRRRSTAPSSSRGSRKRQTVIVDLKAGFGEVALFLGVRPRYTVLDALENLHRLDKDFLSELCAKHKSGLEILAGSEQFERPGRAGRRRRRRAVPASSASRTITSSSTPATRSTRAPSPRSTRPTQFSWSPSRTSRPCATRSAWSTGCGSSGVGGERIRILLNRASDQHMIGQKQIETALGYGIHHTFPSDYRTVSTALNSGVPLALANNSEIASQFDASRARSSHPAKSATRRPSRSAARRFSFSFGFLS